jgi:hypothetical protein
MRRWHQLSGGGADRSQKQSKDQAVGAGQVGDLRKLLGDQVDAGRSANHCRPTYSSRRQDRAAG